mmetsp:Transcript_5579/g.14167  ORF Transcript_5579/g.14167 Transcript_5579/m.14167 type:complete len:93 (-) Transcript_5579:243-521(-)|eukprot:CAMPEP_0197578230 /NCGR_PEP_ID=MMETSP1326-20131121/2539_1 /TAXON_ID=1155430 /ORGANISM="Genus nov. species nov., Strain RCC2288" /LENGTH=92 /DNA_ID=CAMNT_0043141397 /DNA_START=178 /DNA_END=456 /DNA_ORIENTATION=-
MAAAAEVLNLYRSMLRSSAKFSNYNIREYTKRKVQEGFHANARLAGEEAAAAVSKAKADHAVLQRQVEVYRMFGSPIKSVLDLKPDIKNLVR